MFSSRQQDHRKATGGDTFQIHLARISDSLESDPHGQLTMPWTVLSTGNLSKRRAVRRLVWRSQAVLVEGVKKLDAELCRCAFCDGSTLDETEVRVRTSRIAN